MTISTGKGWQNDEGQNDESRANESWALQFASAFLDSSDLRSVSIAGR